MTLRSAVWIVVVAWAAACSSTSRATPVTEPSPPAVDDQASPGLEPLPAALDHDAGSHLVDGEPEMGVWLDGERVTTLPWRVIEWDGLARTPQHLNLSDSFVLQPGGDVTLQPVFPADLLVSVYSPRPTDHVMSRALDKTTDHVFATPEEPGVYAVDIVATFPTSASYAGSGSLRYGFWLSVVGEGCPAAGLAGVPPSGFTDGAGCVAAHAAGGVNLGALTPFQHCGAGPAMVRVTAFRGHQWFERHTEAQFGMREVPLVDLPADAVSTDLFFNGVEVLFAESDRDAAFVRRPDGLVERWAPGPTTGGCI